MELAKSSPIERVESAPAIVPAPDPLFRKPEVADGASLWRVARDSGELDLNSSYAYLLWCRDFAESSIVAVSGGRICGFVTGYLRPDAPETFFLWQVAVDADHRGRAIAMRMLTNLIDRLIPRGVRWLETTVTPSNTASNRLFASFAERRGATQTFSPLFTAADYPDAHEEEVLHRIGPLTP